MDTNRSMRRLLSWTRIAIGVGLLYYLLVAPGRWEAATDFRSNTWMLPTLMVLVLIGAFTEAARLRILCRVAGLELSLLRGLWLTCVGIFFSYYVPGGTGGDVARLYYLSSKHDRPTAEMAVVLLLDRACGLFALLVVILVLAPFNRILIGGHAVIGWLVTSMALVLALLLAMLAALFSEGLRQRPKIASVMRWLPFQQHTSRASSTLDRFRRNPSGLILATLVNLLGFASLALIFIVQGRVFLPGAGAIEVSFLAFTGMLANALPITPGGLGVGEAAFEGLFSLAGFSGGAKLLLGWRIGTLPLIVAGGVLYARGLRRAEFGVEPGRSGSPQKIEEQVEL